jgi:polyhydroxyalkanoate synthesis regulator phasin
MKGAIMSIRKRLAVGAATATLGLVLGATVLSPVVAGAQESTTTTTADESTSSDGIDRTVRGDRVRESLEDLVTDGTITAAQADAVAEHLAQFGPGPGHGHLFRRHIAISLDIAAETIGIERSALVEALADGQTIAEIAADNGTNAGAVIDALVAAHEAKLDELVSDGSITAEEAAERAAEAAERIADLVNGEMEFRQGFGPRPDFVEPDSTEGA